MAGRRAWCPGGGRGRNAWGQLFLGALFLSLLTVAPDRADAGGLRSGAGRLNVALGARAVAAEEAGTFSAGFAATARPERERASPPLEAPAETVERTASPEQAAPFAETLEQAASPSAETAGQVAPEQAARGDGSVPSGGDTDRSVPGRTEQTEEAKERSPVVAGRAAPGREGADGNFAVAEQRHAPGSLQAQAAQAAPPGRAAPAAPAQTDRKAAPSGSGPSGIRLFGSVEFRGALKDMPKWERVLNAERRSPTFDKDLGAVMRPAVYAQWKELVQRMEKATTLEKLRAVNVFFNRWPYRTDREAYKVEDYWATPMEFLKQSGDCEDYAITKFFALKKLGVPPESMRVVALIDKIRNLAHAVLVVYTDGNAYVLDNLTDLVFSHERFKQYAPQYSVNEVYRWAHITPTKKR